jgi:hypothetical protein
VDAKADALHKQLATATSGGTEAGCIEEQLQSLKKIRAEFISENLEFAVKVTDLVVVMEDKVCELGASREEKEQLKKKGEALRNELLAVVDQKMEKMKELEATKFELECTKSKLEATSLQLRKVATESTYFPPLSPHFPPYAIPLTWCTHLSQWVERKKNTEREREREREREKDRQ